jgi:hypothetical protein
MGTPLFRVPAYGFSPRSQVLTKHHHALSNPDNLDKLIAIKGVTVDFDKCPYGNSFCHMSATPLE